MQKELIKRRIALLSIMLFILTITNPIMAFSPSSNNIYDGIDVSGWQGTIDYAEVKNAGIEIVYIKSSEGFSYTDPYFETNYTQAKANGLKVGFYHYVTARTTEQAEEQARFFASVVSGKNPDCRLAMDFESFGDLSVEEINQISQVFLETTQNLTGKDMVIYSNVSNARGVFSQELANSYPLWVAEYEVSEPVENGKWDTWVGWQYTSTGNVSGINGNVDRDYYTDGILLEDTSEVPEPEPSPTPNPTPEPENTTIYVIKYGDTLSSIAAKFNTTVEKLVELNNISNPNLIYAGRTLIIEITGDTEEGTSQSNTIRYTVKYGDTLNSLARRYNTTVQSIVTLNGIRNPNLIYVGQVLTIQRDDYTIYGDTNHKLYTVRYGDTLWAIARRYNTTINAIATLNGIQNPNRIYAGTVLRIPNY